MLLYATDLLFTTKVSATARAASAPLAIVRGVASLREKLASGEHRTLIVDLDADDAVAAIEETRATGSGAGSPIRILAFVSHVRADLVAAARAAGADEVMARSAFVMRLEAIVSEGG